MGGGTFGNRTAAAEFNIWADPEAAAVVFGYGGPLIMGGLDLTHQFQATPERIDQVRAAARRLAADARRPVRRSSAARTSAGTRTCAARRCTTRCAVLALTHPRAVRPDVRTCRHRDRRRAHPRA